MINQKAASQYRAIIVDLQKTISTDPLFVQFRESLLELIIRGLVDTSSETALYHDLERHMIPIAHELHHQVQSTYDELIRAVNLYYHDLADDLSRNHHKIRAIERINASRIGSYSKRTLKRITQTVREGLKQDVSATELAKLLKEKTDIASHYADTLGRTQVAGYGSECKMIKAEIGGIDRFEYTGFIRPTTRPFCLPMVGKVFTLAEINSMRNGQIEPVRIYRGGYNCHHHWEPVIL